MLWEWGSNSGEGRKSELPSGRSLALAAANQRARLTCRSRIGLANMLLDFRAEAPHWSDAGIWEFLAELRK